MLPVAFCSLIRHLDWTLSFLCDVTKVSSSIQWSWQKATGGVCFSHARIWGDSSYTGNRVSNKTTDRVEVGASQVRIDPMIEVKPLPKRADETRTQCCRALSRI